MMPIRGLIALCLVLLLVLENTHGIRGMWSEVVETPRSVVSLPVKFYPSRLTGIAPCPDWTSSQDFLI